MEPTAQQDVVFGQSIPDKPKLEVEAGSQTPLINLSMIPSDLLFEETLPVAQHTDTAGQETAVRLTPKRLSCIVMGVTAGVVEPPVVNLARGPPVVAEEFSASSCT
jgi:hypothetical protein